MKACRARRHAHHVEVAHEFHEDAALAKDVMRRVTMKPCHRHNVKSAPHLCRVTTLREDIKLPLQAMPHRAAK